MDYLTAKYGELYGVPELQSTAVVARSL